MNGAEGGAQIIVFVVCLDVLCLEVLRIKNKKLSGWPVPWLKLKLKASQIWIKLLLNLKFHLDNVMKLHHESHSQEWDSKWRLSISKMWSRSANHCYNNYNYHHNHELHGLDHIGPFQLSPIFDLITFSVVFQSSYFQWHETVGFV